MPSSPIATSDRTGEWLLLQAILAADWTANATRNWQAIPFHRIDWDRLPALAAQHKVRPMTAMALREAGWPGVPPAVRSAIEADERRCTQKTMSQLKLFGAIADGVAAAGLRVLTLKGAALSCRLYANPFLREAFDIDLLVHRDDVARMSAIIQAAGCEPVIKKVPRSPRQNAIMARFSQHEQFRCCGSDTIVECHWQLDRNPYLITTAFDDWWREHETIALAGAVLAVPGRDDLVHHLCVHAARHQWERWKWIADLVALWRGLDDDGLNRQRERAADDGNGAIFDSTLLIVQTVTGIVLPQAALDRAGRNPRARLLADWAIRRSGKDRSRETGSKSALHRAAYGLALKPSVSYVARELGTACYRERDWYALRLPDRLIWLYYVARPLSYLIRFLKRRLPTEGLKT